MANVLNGQHVLSYTVKRHKPQCAALVHQLAHFLRVMSSLHTFLHMETFSKLVPMYLISFSEPKSPAPMLTLCFEHNVGAHTEHKTEIPHQICP